MIRPCVFVLPRVIIFSTLFSNTKLFSASISLVIRAMIITVTGTVHLKKFSLSLDRDEKIMVP
jgi:hypothetical protein